MLLLLNSMPPVYCEHIGVLIEVCRLEEFVKLGQFLTNQPRSYYESIHACELNDS